MESPKLVHSSQPMTQPVGEHTDKTYMHKTSYDVEQTRYTMCDTSVYLANKANLRNLIAATGLVISNWIQTVNFSARVTVKFDG